MSVTPRTEAGRQVWAEIADSIECGGGLHVSECDIAAIEAEARAAVLADLAKQVEGLPGWRDPRYSGRQEATGLIHRGAVLRLIQEKGATP